MSRYPSLENSYDSMRLPRVRTITAWHDDPSETPRYRVLRLEPEDHALVVFVRLGRRARGLLELGLANKLATRIEKARAPHQTAAMRSADTALLVAG